MQIVIEIPEQKYNWIVNNPQTYTDELHEAIRNGTPLPKNHGRLIDADEMLIWLLDKGFVMKMGNDEITRIFTQATVIEADKEGDADDK